MKAKKNVISDEMNRLINESKDDGVSLRLFLKTLSGRGHALFLILLVLPFCQPISIPGFSTVFGLMIAFIGLRIGFGSNAWVPENLLKKKIPKKALRTLAKFSIKLTNKLRYFITTRLTFMLKDKLYPLHGLTTALLALLLSLPLPIPFTNLLCAYPILFFGFGLLEDDGLMIIIAYLLSFVCFLGFFLLFWFGKEGMQLLFHIYF